LDLDYEIVNSFDSCPENSISINYSERKVPFKSISIRPSRILNEDNIYAQNISVQKTDNNIPYFFASYAFEGDYIFDLFGLVFYQLSRYEEYLRFQPDKYGRFSASNSLAYRNDFLNCPIVDIWIWHLKNSIEVKWNIKVSMKRTFIIHPTVDIDTPYAFLSRPFYFQCMAIIRDILLLRARRLSERILTLIGKRQDPFDTYDYLIKLKATFFLLMKFNLPDDHNFSVNTKKFKALIRRLSLSSEIGIHPSLHSSGKRKRIEREKDNLASIAEKPIHASRQHFLNLQFPTIYQVLIDLGIKEEYSMGFHDKSGFRAGTSISFPWFDLSKNEKTELIIRPFQIMDATLRHHQNMAPLDAIEEINAIKREIKSVRGEFRIIWHNSSFADIYEWKGWDNVLKACLSQE